MRPKPQHFGSKKRPQRPEKGGKRPGSGPAGGATRPDPSQSFQEPTYLRQLAKEKSAVVVKLKNNEELEGVVEYYDSRFLRLTREDGANLFVFKHDIKYLTEGPRGPGKPANPNS